jgi:integrase
MMREAAKLGIPAGRHPHSLRHQYATSLLSANAPIHIVSKYLGHRSVEITSRVYAHVLPSDFGRVRDVLDNVYSTWRDTPPDLPAAA